MPEVRPFGNQSPSRASSFRISGGHVTCITRTVTVVEVGVKRNGLTALRWKLRACVAIILILAGIGKMASWATTAGTQANIGLRDVYARKGESVKVPVVLSYYSDEERRRIESVSFRLELSNPEGFRIVCLKGSDAGKGAWRTSCELQPDGRSVHVVAGTRESGPKFESGAELIYEIPIEIRQTVSLGDTCRLRLSDVGLTADGGSLQVGTTPATIHTVEEQEFCAFYHGVFSILDMVFRERGVERDRPSADYDVDGDGLLSVRDAVYLSLHEAALISELPICATSSEHVVPRVVEGKMGQIRILPPERISHSSFYKYRLVAGNAKGLLGADISLMINDGFVWDGPKNSKIPFHQLKAGTDSSRTRYRIVFTTNLPIDTDEEIEVFEVKVQQNTDESVFSQESFTYYVLDSMPSSTATQFSARTRTKSAGRYVTSSNGRIKIADKGLTPSFNSSYFILDLNGRTVQKGQLDGDLITRPLPSAQYLIRIHEEHGFSTVPIIVAP